MSSSNQVQGTNDSSCVSKLSAASRGYFCDDFLQYFVQKAHRRSSLINRGYYIRFKAVEAVFNEWFSFLRSVGFPKSQVISFGAGYDTTYFRLKKEKKLPDSCTYIEVDFLRVLAKKLHCINSHAELKEFSGSGVHAFPNIAPEIVHATADYVLLGVDMGDTKRLQFLCDAIELDYSSPTLFLSECALTYMDVNRSSELISWCREHFPNAAFVLYEQVDPHDGFGAVMCKHFSTLGCPLRSLKVYPTEKEQHKRFLDMGWRFCYTIRMNTFFSSLPSEERERIQDLELFDEYEMWHEKCSHYILLHAVQGSVFAFPSLLAKPSQFCYGLSSDAFCPGGMVSKSFNPPASLCCPVSNPLHCTPRYGHRACPITSEVFLLSGGFGKCNQRHQRMKTLICGNLKTGRSLEVSVIDPENGLGERMYHSMTTLSNDRVVVLGGRSAPNKPFDDALRLDISRSPACNCMVESKHHVPEVNCSKQEEMGPVTRTECVKCSITVSKIHGVSYEPRWRHSASVVVLNGIEHIIFFGGCTLTQKATNQCLDLNTATWTLSEVPSHTEAPSARHSHSSVTASEDNVIVSGGLTYGEESLNSVHIFNASSRSWEALNIKGLFPRYSHTSHVWKRNLILIGGVSTVSNLRPFIGVVNLDTLAAVEISMPATHPDILLLHGHESLLMDEKIYTIGGGGNCFSFGTHFNDQLMIDVQELAITAQQCI